jgi:cytochrome o ubiquinol oxidase subunit 1
MKKHGYQRPLAGFEPIHMPANTGAGVVISGFSLVCGFALIWHMWPLAAASFVAVVLSAIVHTFNYQRDFYIPAAEVAQTENTRTQLLARHV